MLAVISAAVSPLTKTTGITIPTSTHSSNAIALSATTHYAALQNCTHTLFGQHLIAQAHFFIGITCLLLCRRVNKLDVVGQIPSELQNLTRLENLYGI